MLKLCKHNKIIDTLTRKLIVTGPQYVPFSIFIKKNPINKVTIYEMLE